MSDNEMLPQGRRKYFVHLPLSHSPPLPFSPSPILPLSDFSPSPASPHGV
ncbi:MULTISPECIES: hypothetical protein [unclassified Microcoleus]